MKVIGLDRKEYRITLANRTTDARAKSSGHKEVRQLLAELYPLDQVFEEILLPGCGVPLYADFFIPSRRLIVEVQGRQHREYVPHFHRGRSEFAAQVRRDKLKIEFCNANRIILVSLHDDQRNEWREVLTNPWVVRDSTNKAG